MIQLDSFWNGKLKGVLGLASIAVPRVFQFVFDRLHSYIVKRNLGDCGRSVIIQRGFRYRYPGNIFLGNNVTIGHSVIFSSEISTSKIIIEDNVTIVRKCEIDFSGNVIIGRGTLISEGVKIQSHDHGLNPRSKPNGKQLIIEENVWIGLNVIILSNVRKIGKNSIIAAGTVVTKEVPCCCIVAGVPGKIIRKNIPIH